MLARAQFPEDAGPLAHPVRPDSYIEISNFYTATVYNKGAELIRMMHTLLGPEKFRAGCDLYFERHDGEAVTCEDFVSAMEEASGVDLPLPPLVRAGRHAAGSGLAHAPGDGPARCGSSRRCRRPRASRSRSRCRSRCASPVRRRTGAKLAERLVLLEEGAGRDRVRRHQSERPSCRSTAASRRRSSSRPTAARRPRLPLGP
jgi:aminopeptidase N